MGAGVRVRRAGRAQRNSPAGRPALLSAFFLIKKKRKKKKWGFVHVVVTSCKKVLESMTWRGKGRRARRGGLGNGKAGLILVRLGEWGETCYKW